MSRKTKIEPSTTTVQNCLWLDGVPRDDVLRQFKKLGGDLNRWKVADWFAMASALTALEDQLELKRGDKPETLRAKIGDVRRMLEDFCDRV